jgi:ABC-type transport system substrate-binding protein
VTYLVTRSDRAPFEDVAFRTAVSAAIDRATISLRLFAGYAHPATGLLPEGHWSKPGGLLPFVHDPAVARATFQRLPPGRALTLLTSTDRQRQTVARFLAQELGDAGLTVEVVPLELGTLIARLNAGDFDMASLQLPELAEPNVLRVFLHSQYIPPAGANRARVRDPEVDRLLDEGAGTTDRTLRAAAYGRLEAHLRERLYLIPLWHEDHVAVTSTRARDFHPSAEGRWLGLASVP